MTYKKRLKRKRIFVFDTSLNKETVFDNAKLAGQKIGVAESSIRSAIKRKSLVQMLYRISYETFINLET